MALNMTTEALGAALAAARRGDGPPVDRDLDREVATEADAETIQAAAIKAYGASIVGYKIGATSEEAQTTMRCDHPFFGPLFDRDLYRPGDTLPFRDTLRCAECEIAFRMGRDYPAPGETVTMEGLLGAVASCHPAIEIVGRRTVGAGLPSIRSGTADFALNAAFVPGEAFAGWRDIDLPGVPISGTVDGEVTNTGYGRHVLGDPRTALLWLAEALARRGRRLAAGQFVSTGSCAGMVPVRPGSTIVASHGPLGGLSIKFGPRT